MTSPSRLVISPSLVTGLRLVCAAVVPLLIAGCNTPDESTDSADNAETQAAESVESTQSALLGLDPVRCDKINFPVTLAEGATTVYNVVGWLCGRGSIANKPIQVLVSGATYSHVYWDFPYKPAQYSYVNALTAAGYATLAIDRIGVGESDHPPAADLTTEGSAHTVHQVIQKLRSGTLTAPTFGRVKAKRIVLVGHSYGSGVSTLEASTYHDIDALIVTGLFHSFGPGALEVASHFLPTSYDPAFAGRNIPDGYLTTAPGSRGGSYFYYAPGTDQNVVAVDEATKDALSQYEPAGAGLGLAGTPAIDVPTFVVTGERDTITCNPPSCGSAALEAEKQFYSPAAHVHVAAIPAAGHCINLEKTAPLWFALAAAWSIRNVGLDTRFPQPPPQP